MNFIKGYIFFHLGILNRLYNRVLLRSDKHIFALLFNIKALIGNKNVRVNWKGYRFLVRDEKYPWFRQEIRSKKAIDVNYRADIEKRIDNLNKAYFLDRIPFKKGDLFLDCGANVGDIFLYFKSNSIDIKYIGFEPSPVEFSCLEQNVYPSKVYNVGLWNTCKKINFYVSSSGEDSSIIEPPTYEEKIDIKAVRLEKFIKGKIKCLKVEAEGAEPEVLEGLGDKLSKIEYITADVGLERGITQQSTLPQVTNFLLSNGFELIDFSKGRWGALFKNKNF